MGNRAAIAPRSAVQRGKTGYFFLRRALIDIVRPHRFGLSPRYAPRRSTTDSNMPYVLDYTTRGMLTYYDMQQDPDGIVLTSHYVDHPGGHGYYYSPTKIAHYALGALNDSLARRDSQGMLKFRLHHRWIMEHFSEELGGISWRIPSTNPKYGLEMNYLTCISQGLALSVLARTEAGPLRERARDLSEAALKPLTVPVEQGGLLATGKWGPCFEEYPCLPYSHVVNGFVFCLNGLFDAYGAFGLEQARELFERGLQTMRAISRVWFVHGWARYDLRDLYTGDVPNLATRHYQYLHADQMHGLAVVTGDSHWRHMARKFTWQAVNPFGVGYAYWCKARKFL